MTDKITYTETSEFQKDFKKLSKRFRTLRSDLELSKQKTIELFFVNGKDNQSIFQIPDFCSESVKVCKIKKFACKSLKGKGAQSGIRVIFAFYPESRHIDLIEIYYKGEQENEDRVRISTYLKRIVQSQNVST
jgi:mRNA-degrading endonuclease RelE of RelBE toxin-antitoxin system